MKALVGAFNQEKAVVVGAVIVKNGFGTDGALHSTIEKVGVYIIYFIYRGAVS